MYPCYTAEAARVLCRFGLERHEVVERAVDYFMGAAEGSGGCRCSFFRFEHRHRNLKGLRFCERGRPSAAATARYLEIGERMENGAG